MTTFVLIPNACIGLCFKLCRRCTRIGTIDATWNPEEEDTTIVSHLPLDLRLKPKAKANREPRLRCCEREKRNKPHANYFTMILRIQVPFANQLRGIQLYPIQSSFPPSYLAP
jgi:hypothetical protein